MTVFAQEAGAWHPVASSPTGEQGEYRVGGLASGAYRVEFFAWNFFQPMPMVTYYEGADTIENADDVQVVAGQTTSGIDATFGTPATGGIAGKVTDGVGGPLEGIGVGIASINGYFWGTANTDANGDYVIEAVPAGDYQVQFFDPSGRFGNATYPNPVTVADTLVTDIDQTLAEAGGIFGSVALDSAATSQNLLLALVQVHAQVNGVWVPVDGAMVNPGGGYALERLAPGTYRLEFFGLVMDMSGTTPFGVYREFHDNVTTIDAASDIVVTSGSSVEINAILDMMQAGGDGFQRATSSWPTLPLADLVRSTNALGSLTVGR